MEERGVKEEVANLYKKKKWGEEESKRERIGWRGIKVVRCGIMGKKGMGGDTW